MKIQKIINTFVASPSDTAEERVILDSVIKEFNVTWADFVGMRIDIIKWETHTWPTIHSDAQTAINEQIQDDYDIFIGIIKKRLGTPTPRADSGTVEEFERAYARNKATKIPKIMFYLHSSSCTIPEVKNFTNRLENLGVYYWQYENKENIAYFWRIHLSKIIQDLAKHQSILQPGKQNFPTPDTAQLKRALKLFGQFISEGTAKFKDYNTNADNLYLTIRTIVQVFQETGTALQNLNRPGFRQQPNARKKLILKLAGALNKHSNKINEVLPQFVTTYFEIMNALGSALSVIAPLAPLPLIFKDFIFKTKQQISQFNDVLVSVRNNAVQARNTISAWPPIEESEFKIGKRKFIESLDKADHIFSQNIKLAREYELIIEDYLDNID